MHEDSLLVIRKSNGPYIGRFDLPGGTIEPNETLSEAVRREILCEKHIGYDHELDLLNFIGENPIELVSRMPE